MRKICSRCHRLVFQPEERNAFGKVWHSFCFSCYVCNKLLDCTNVQIAKDELYCTDCFIRQMKDDNNDDQCPSEQCIQSVSSRIRSTDDLKAKDAISDVESINAVIYPCSIPVPYSVSAWYNRQHQRKLNIKQVFCEPSCELCKSATAPAYKGGKESECTCPPSPSPSHSKEIKPDTISEAGEKCKKLVTFEFSNKEQRQNTRGCCQSQVSASPLATPSSSSSRHSGRSNESLLKQMKLSSTTYNAECCCDSFKPIAAIKAALQKSVMASLEPKPCYCTNEQHSTQRVKYGRNTPLGGGLDCRRCGRKVYFAEMFSVAGAVYHDICFCCLDCRKPLEITNVYPTRGDIYCRLCYIRNFGLIGYGYGQGSGVLLSPNP